MKAELEAPTLAGGLVRLEPLAAEHLDGLVAASGQPRTPDLERVQRMVVRTPAQREETG